MESKLTEVAGLGLLSIQTVLKREKTTRVMQAKTPGGHGFSAYEIHLGETTMLCSDPAPFALLEDGSHDGLRAGSVIGTYLHGALEDPEVLAELGIIAAPAPSMPYSRLADWFAPYGESFEELFL
jgi:adenosylcobyric acid synthase